MRALLFLFLTFILTSQLHSQWQTKFTSVPVYNGVVSGWINFKKIDDRWENRMFVLDSTSFKVMAAAYSTEVQYTYSFTSEEKLAGCQLYSLREDVTGDDIVDFYVVSYYGMSSNYREAFKILDITDNSTVFEKNETAYSYSAPEVWDVDGDKMLECVVTKTAYPSEYYYFQEVYGTRGAASTKDNRHPENFVLKQNFPNPFNPSTKIEFNIGSASNVTLRIYDIKGSLVKDLFSGYLEDGLHKIDWDGTNNEGYRCASGIYMYRLNSGDLAENKKMIMLK